MMGFLTRLNLTQQDMVRATGLIIGYLMTSLIPRRFDRWLVDRFSSFYLRRASAKTERLAAQMAEAIGPAAEDVDLLAGAANYKRMVFEGVWGRVRGMHKGGWKPRIQIDGLGKLREALAEGKGVILWRMSCCNSSVGKRGLWEAGIPMVHLSLDHHGAWSRSSRVGRLMNSFYRRSEDPYLKERVIISDGGGLGYLKVLIDRLGDNAVVSMFGEHASRQKCAAPFLQSQAIYATGAPALAQKTGAALLTSHVVREGSSSYRVVIDGPIEMDDCLSRKEFVSSAVAEFSRRLETVILQSPESWEGWGGYFGGESRFERAPSNQSTDTIEHSEAERDEDVAVVGH